MAEEDESVGALQGRRSPKSLIVPLYCLAESAESWRKGLVHSIRRARISGEGLPFRVVGKAVLHEYPVPAFLPTRQNEVTQFDMAVLPGEYLHSGRSLIHALIYRAAMKAVVQARGIEGVRVLVGLKTLALKHETEALERACDTALTYGAYRLRTIRELLKRQAPAQKEFDFLEEHPVIRPLRDCSVNSLLEFRKERPCPLPALPNR